MGPAATAAAESHSRPLLRRRRTPSTTATRELSWQPPGPSSSRVAACAATRKFRLPGSAARERYTAVMAERTVRCVKLGQELPGLDKPPFSGALGQRIFEGVSKRAWELWQQEAEK